MKKFVIFIALLLSALNLQFFAQTSERKKPELKDFGSSLSPKPEESSAQKKKTVATKDSDTIYIETNLVVVDFLVLDKKGNTIYGLKKDDFVVTEDNKPQEIQTFTLGDDKEIPRSIVLIIDYSGSQLPFIERNVEATKLLVDKLRPNDLMALVTDDVELISQFTSDKALLKEKLELLKQNALARKVGKSMQFSALYAVLSEMFDDEDVRPIVLFQTDGDQFNNLKGGFNEILGLPPFAPNMTTNFNFNDLLSSIEKSRATIYTIVPGFRLLGLSPQERSAKLRADREMRMKMSQPL
ncbi:MAG: VWA domain-containing protein, partial [Acidobacteriota bacterium]